MNLQRPLFASALVLACSFGLATPPALACGGLFCQNIPVEQAGERIIFFADGETVTAHVQIQYQGAAKDFSWIVPTPTQPTLRVGTERLFQALRNTTRPTFQVEMERTDGECAQMDFAMSARAGGVPMAATAESGVTVVEERPVGPFDTAVLQANDSAVLKKWLTDNEYIVPPQVDPLLDPYVAGKYYFIALKLRKDRDAGDMQPITFTYAATKPGIPIRLTGVAATPDMGVFVWVFGKHRAVPDNYRHAAINEARIDWFGQGGNYAQVVTEAMNEAGGQAFVTDYAGSNSVIDPSAFEPGPLESLVQELAGIADPVQFTQRVLANARQLQQSPGISIGRPFPGGGDDKAIAFLKRHVPKPSTLSGLTDEEFYYGIEKYAGVLTAAQVSVNGKRVEAELEETVVGPARDISEKLKTHPYLTRLYSTMSPEEMTQDPTFVFNPDAEEMSNVHVAKGVRLCSSNYNEFNAPVELTLKNGLKFVVQPSGRGVRPLPAPSQGDEVVALPAALRIEQYTTSGVANVIANVQEQVQTTLTRLGRGSAALGMNSSGAPVSIGVTVPRTSGGASTGASSGTSSSSSRTNSNSTTGFGCSGCANPNRSAEGGADDGLALGLFGVGMLGWRFWSRKRR